MPISVPFDTDYPLTHDLEPQKIKPLTLDERLDYILAKRQERREKGVKLPCDSEDDEVVK